MELSPEYRRRAYEYAIESIQQVCQYGTPYVCMALADYVNKVETIDIEDSELVINHIKIKPFLVPDLFPEFAMQKPAWAPEANHLGWWPVWQISARIKALQNAIALLENT